MLVSDDSQRNLCGDSLVDYQYQYSPSIEEGKEVKFPQLIEQFKRLPTVTQVALVLFALVVVVLLAVYPAAGTSIIAFLVAIKMLTKQH